MHASRRDTTLRIEPDPSIPLVERLVADEGQEEDSEEMIEGGEEEEGEEGEDNPIIR